METANIIMGFYIAGLVLALNGGVQLIARKAKWPEGGANFITGMIVAGVAVVLLMLLVAL